MLRTSRALMGTAQRLPLLMRSTHTKSFNTPVATFVSRKAELQKSTGSPLVLRSAFSSKPPLQPNQIDTQFEKELAQQKLKADPEHVSEDSSVRPFFEQDQAPPSGVQAKDTSKSLKDDLVSPQDRYLNSSTSLTFSSSRVLSRTLWRSRLYLERHTPSVLPALFLT